MPRHGSARGAGRRKVRVRSLGHGITDIEHLLDQQYDQQKQDEEPKPRRNPDTGAPR